MWQRRDHAARHGARWRLAVAALALAGLVAVVAGCAAGDGPATIGGPPSGAARPVSAAGATIAPEPTPIPSPTERHSDRDSTAVLTGRLLAVGGPAGTPNRPLPGRVTVTAQASGVHLSTKTAADGSFSIALAPGTYDVVGVSPQYEDGSNLCRAEQAVRLAAGAAAHADVYCQEK